MDVLVVEDDPLVRQVLVEELRDAGFDVAEAPSAEVAFDLAIAEGPPAVLVTDLKLVGVGGLAAGNVCGHALATVMRRRWPELAVLYITGHPEYLLERRLGLRERRLTKPFSPMRLVRAVRDLLPRGKEEPAAA
jgi:DNA-binding response OmpR family regulator